jgi:hypothetical protein
MYIVLRLISIFVPKVRRLLYFVMKCPLPSQLLCVRPTYAGILSTKLESPLRTKY